MLYKGVNMSKQKYDVEFNIPKGSFFGRMLYKNRMCDVHFFKGWNFNGRQQYDYVCRYGEGDKYMSGLVSDHKYYQEKNSINLYSAFLKWKGNII